MLGLGSLWREHKLLMQLRVIETYGEDFVARVIPALRQNRVFCH